MSGLWVRHSPSSASVVRDSLSLALKAAGVADDDAYDATLLVSELVGNAIRHAPSLPSGHVQVQWAISTEGCRLDVTDGGHSEHHLDPITASDSDVSGRGLAIVSCLAEAWGMKSAEFGTTVWAFYRFSHTTRRPNGMLAAC